MDNVLRRQLYASDFALDVYYCPDSAKYCDRRVRLSVSPTAYLKNQTPEFAKFLVLKLWPWFGPILAALRCVYTSGFVVDVTFSNNVSE